MLECNTHFWLSGYKCVVRVTAQWYNTSAPYLHIEKNYVTQRAKRCSASKQIGIVKVTFLTVSLKQKHNTHTTYTCSVRALCFCFCSFYLSSNVYNSVFLLAFYVIWFLFRQTEGKHYTFSSFFFGSILCRFEWFWAGIWLNWACISFRIINNSMKFSNLRNSWLLSFSFLKKCMKNIEKIFQNIKKRERKTRYSQLCRDSV